MSNSGVINTKDALMVRSSSRKQGRDYKYNKVKSEEMKLNEYKQTFLQRRQGIKSYLEMAKVEKDG